MSFANRLFGIACVSVWLALAGGCGGEEKVADTSATGRRPMPQITITGKIARYVYGTKTIAQWLDDLDAPEWSKRSEAAAMLCAMGPDAIVVLPALIWALDDEDGRVRAEVASGLHFMAPAADRLVPILLDRAERDNFEVARSACGSLSSLANDTPQAVAALVRLTGGKRSNVRESAVRALGDAWNVTEPAVIRLLELAADPGSPLRSSAAVSLGRLNVLAVPGLLAGLQDPRPAVAKLAYETLSRTRKNARSAVSSVPALAWALRHEQWTVRWAAAEFLADMGSAAKGAAPDLIAALDDKVAVVASEAARALGGIGPEGAGAVPALIRTLRTPTREDPVRWSAADALRPLASADDDVLKALLEATPALLRRTPQEDIGDEETAALLEATRDKVGEVRAAVSAALGKVGAASVPALRESLRHADPIVRQAAACVLGDLGADAEAALDDLIAALADPDAGVRAEAARAIGALGRRAGKAAPAVRLALRDGDPRARSEGAAALGRVGPDPTIDAPELVKLLEDPQAQFEAACALAGMGGDAGARAVPILILEVTSLFNPHAFQAEDALVQIGGAAVPELLKALQAADQDVFKFAKIATVLEKIGPEAKAAVPVLGESLGNKSSIIRLNAARALGGIGPDASAAAPRLKERLDDPDEEVRKAAKEALAKVEGASGGS
jgi:HEAT repeat protein